MKISKLFHWLYASVMLLPIFAIGSTCLINTFNQEAKHELKINYKYKSNEVREGYYNEDIKVGNLYYINDFDYSLLLDPDGNAFISFDIFSYDVDSFSFDGPWIDDFNFYSEDKISDAYISVYFIYSQQYSMWENSCSFYSGSSQINLADYVDEFVISNAIIRFSDRVSIENFLSYYAYDNATIFSYCDKNVIESVEEKNISNTFYDSINSVVSSDIFSWAYDSFLSAPFVYIVNLFSMPVDSPIVLLLSYWLSISIIWLVFDLVMYVPLLVHRWLDKGVLE